MNYEPRATPYRPPSLVISCFLGMIILEQEEADEVFDQGPLIQGGDHEDSLVVLQVRNLHTQKTLNAASPDLL